MRIKRHYSVIAHGVDTVEIRHGVWNPVSFSLTDETHSSQLYRIIRHFREDTTAAEVAGREGVSLAEVEGLIDRLLELGALEAEPTSALDYYLNYCIPTLVPTAERRVKQFPVTLLGDAAIVTEIESNLALRPQSDGVTLLADDSRLWEGIANGPSDWSTNGIVLQECIERLSEWRHRFLVHASKTIKPLELKLFNRVALAN